MKLRRIGSELVHRSLAKSRTTATQIIRDGRVKFDGQIMLKPARRVDPARTVVVEESDGPECVSRGAHKLAGALDVFGDKAPLAEGRRTLDAGASIGGFIDVLSRRGVAFVVAVDVRHDQLMWKLQSDPRVEVHDRMDVCTLDPVSVTSAPELVVDDISFTSLTLVLPALAAAAVPRTGFLPMIRLQFGIGKERLGHEGVVRNLEHHVETVEAIARYAIERDLDITVVATSPLPGPSGNVRYFIHICRDYPDPIDPTQLTDYVRRIIEAGPARGFR